MNTPPTNRLLNVLLLLAALCCGLLLVLRYGPQDANGEQAPGPRWYTTAGREGLPDAFVWTGTFTDTLGEGGRLRHLLLGQTTRLDVVCSAAEVQILRQTSRQDKRVVAAGNWPLRPESGDQLELVKRENSVAVYLNGERFLRAVCPVETWSGSLWQSAVGTNPVADFSFQRTAPVHFADDFMHGDDEFGPWTPERGDWTVLTRDNPVRSANAFSLVGEGEDALVSTGNWFWHSYAAEVSARSLGKPDFALMFCRRPGKGHYAVTVRDDGNGTQLAVSRRVGGVVTSLGKRPISFRANAWYRLRASQSEGMVSVSIDGRLVFRAFDPSPLPGGGFALATRNEAGTVFDDVRISPAAQTHLDLAKAFGGESSVPHTGPLAVHGDWSFTDNGAILPGETGGGRLTFIGTTPENPTVHANVANSADIGEQYRLTLRARETGRNWVGFRFREGGNGGTAELVSVHNAEEKVLAATPLRDGPAAGDFSLIVHNRTAYASLNGRILCQTNQLPPPTPGSCSVHLGDNSKPMAISRAACAVTEEMPSLDNRVETFVHERSMSNWSNPAHEWQQHNLGGKRVFLHRSDFWNDVATIATLDDEALQDGGTVGLLLTAGGESDTPSITARCDIRRLKSPENDDEPYQLQLRIGEEVVEETRLATPPVALRLERFYNRLQVRRENVPLWSVSLPDGLGGLLRAGRYGGGEPADWVDRTEIRARGVRTYPFKEAPVDWQPAGGTWEVTNRWQCDPRWSFFSGHNLQGTACLWNKHRFPNNLTVEFFVGPKMDRERGHHYEYAADLNAVLSADGADIKSGYSFMLGGWDDSGSHIVRGKDVLKKNPKANIPRKGSTHRRWFYVKARRDGERLTMWLDNKKVVETVDENPLAGDRMGLWTWKNGMMVAYVRISADTIASKTDPPLKPADAPPLTPYD